MCGRLWMSLIGFNPATSDRVGTSQSEGHMLFAPIALRRSPEGSWGKEQERERLLQVAVRNPIRRGRIYPIPDTLAEADLVGGCCIQCDKLRGGVLSDQLAEAPR